MKIDEISNELDLKNIQYKDYERYIAHVLFLVIKFFSKKIYKCNEERFIRSFFSAFNDMFPNSEELIQKILEKNFIYAKTNIFIPTFMTIAL